ncbi:short-chain dehydrogenase [Candidatus Pacearchaeota archaeon CG10_big_fil_rev_8_21_14_0_10_32_14]|nr:MAG: short-chain dehydrogenase [Candidatus Pacearchaeota archaeon CG10_big_fil_rev_8_21_14_0_10_32_14]
MKTALVTGASRGIGYEFSNILGREGYNLVLVSRNKKKLKEIKDEFENKYKVKVIYFEIDLSGENSAFKLYKKIKDDKIEIDVLINNAGFGDYGEFIKTDWQKEKEMIELNVVALTHLTKLFSKDMVSRKNGMILNVASMAGFLPGPLMTIYYSTKAYVVSFSQAVNNELKGTGVSVTVLCPGPTQSGFQYHANMNQSKLVKGIKLVSAKEVAEYGYKSMIKKKSVAINGVRNKFAIFLIRFAPRDFVTWFSRKVLERRRV